MVVLSRVLRYRANRWANIAGAAQHTAHHLVRVELAASRDRRTDDHGVRPPGATQPTPVG
jgi:hypothetical protein